MGSQARQYSKTPERADVLAAMRVYRKAQAARLGISPRTPAYEPARQGFRQAAEALRAMGALDAKDDLIITLTDAEHAELRAVYHAEKQRLQTEKAENHQAALTLVRTESDNTPDNAQPVTPENADFFQHHSVRKWPEPPPLDARKAAIQRAKQECLAWQATVQRYDDKQRCYLYSHEQYLRDLANWKAAQERLNALCPPVLTYTCQPSPAIARRLHKAAQRAALEKALQRSEEVSAYMAAEKAYWHAQHTTWRAA